MKLDGRTRVGRAVKRAIEEKVAAEWRAVRERAATCPACREIPDSLFIDYIWEPKRNPPLAMISLVEVRNLGYCCPFILRCPLCGVYYRYEHSCGYMEHDDSWERLRDSEAEALIGVSAPAKPPEQT